MKKERRNEIAWDLLVYKASREPIHLGQGSLRELGNIAKAIGVSVDELKEFTKELIDELVSKTFGD